MKTMNKKVLIAMLLIVGIVISGFTVLTLMQGAQAISGTIIKTDPIEVVIPYCQNRTVSICVENFTNLGRFQFEIWWLKDAVEFVDYEWKSLPPGWADAVRQTPSFQENATHKAVMCYIYSNPPSPSSFAGAWAFIDLKYHCIKPDADTGLTFDRTVTRLFDPGGFPITIGTIIDGHVTNLPMQMYWKQSYIDYAPSGVPDFDQRQDNWFAPGLPPPPFYSWCAPTAVANSLWWMDSKFESMNSPPPARVDSFPLVTSYIAGIDDHDPANVVPFNEHLHYLMDTDGNRTGIVHVGTNVFDMQTGIAQYLSWTGVNPPGDVNGDGTVNQTDLNIVNAAIGSTPGNQTWNMAADIWPATLGWPSPGVADNKVDINDLNLVQTFMNTTGYFCEKTVTGPEFSYVEQQVERCNDVILSIGFYSGPDLAGNYHRNDTYYEWPGIEIYGPNTGHCVTMAGVNSTTKQIAICDPAQNTAEQTGMGRVLPKGDHGHPQNPPDLVHNNATFVSQDIYTVNNTALPPLLDKFGQPVPANFSIVGYSDPFHMFPNALAVVEHAIVISPLHPLPPQFTLEPRKLSDLVEWSGKVGYVDVPFALSDNQQIEGYNEILDYLRGKGYTFNPTDGTATEVSGQVIKVNATGQIMQLFTQEFNGTVTSWWSNNTLANGTRACVLSAQMGDGSTMAMAFVTNLLPPELLGETNPYIIVNAMPYTYVTFYWWAWQPIGKIVSWSYWWYGSDSHPNWFWGLYWWWRTCEKTYLYGLNYGLPYPSFPWAEWRPWWEWWWHWTYWKHWYWWSTYFPYDP
jgi:hypothetical protein